MKGIKRYISRKWIWIVAGLILTGVFVKMAYAERGYVAYGGEWLTMPLILMVVELARDVRDTVKSLFGMEDGSDGETFFVSEREE